MKKTNVKIIVQGPYDSSDEFANEIERTIENIIENYKEIVGIPKLFSITSSSSGRQTATIVFYTEQKEKSIEIVEKSDTALFNAEYLQKAIINYFHVNKVPELSTNYYFKGLIEFLLKQKQKDYK